MNLEELREKLKAEWDKSLDQLEENRIFVETRDRYENLTPIQQKLAIAGVIGAIALFIASIPLSYYTASEESMMSFTDTRQSIRDLLKTAKDSKDIPRIPIPPDIDSLKSQVQSSLTSAQLLPEQIGTPEVDANPGRLIPQNTIEGVLKIPVQDLNLRQIVDFGHQFSAMSPSVKLKDLQITASLKNPGYFDVIYQLLVLKVTSPKSEEAEAAPKKGRKK